MNHSVIPLTLIVMAAAPLRAAAPVPAAVTPERIPGAKPRNVVFSLSDDHRD